MAQIILDITPTSALTRSVDALCGLNGYQTTIDDGSGNQIPNPESRNAFSKRMLAKFLKSQIVQWESGIAMEAARASSTASAESLSIT